MEKQDHRPWVKYNHLTNTYDTRDGTKVPAELVENAQCLADFVLMAELREEQRKVLAARSNIK